jgi:hypothetical protein
LIRIKKLDFLEITEDRSFNIRVWLSELAQDRTQDLFEKIIFTLERRAIFEKTTKRDTNGHKAYIQRFLA